MNYKLYGGKVVLPHKIIRANITIEDGIIKSIDKKKARDKGVKIIDAKGKYILPGFVDIHTNGIAGFDVTNGSYNLQTDSFSVKKENYLSSLETALKEYANHGTTLVGLTSLETTLKKLKKVFSFIGEYKTNSRPLSEMIFGIYMEGSFMKDINFKGAHNHDYFFTPTNQLFDDLQNAADGNIKIVNVVPEWGSKGIRFIKYMQKKNIIVAIGHTAATAKETKLAIKNGASIGIHLFNGPSFSSYKPFDGGGAVEEFIKSDKVFTEVIADGYHVDKSYLLDLIKRKGIDKTVVVTDGMFTIGVKGLRKFTLNSIKAKVSNNKEYLLIDDDKRKNALCGSALNMDKAFENLLNWFTTPQPGVWNELHNPKSFDEAVRLSSELCSATPAKAINVFKRTKNNSFATGSIETKKRADLFIADIKKINQKYRVNVDKVFLNGVEVK